MLHSNVENLVSVKQRRFSSITVLANIICTHGVSEKGKSFTAFLLSLVLQQQHIRHFANTLSQERSLLFGIFFLQYMFLTASVSEVVCSNTFSLVSATPTALNAI